MNIILFAPDEFSATPDAAPAFGTLTLPRDDARAVHIVEVLRRKTGDAFDAGLIDGPRGKGTLAAISSASAAAGGAHTQGTLSLTFSWEKNEPLPLPPITLIIGLPRPQTARKILNEATSLGVAEMHFVATERGEPSYAQSTLWSTAEYKRHLVAGAAQAFCTRIPRITFAHPLSATLSALASAQPRAHRIALDNYESPAPLSAQLAAFSVSAGTPIILCLGSERGWTSGEREQLRAASFTFAHLGARVLRTETAVVAAVTLALARFGIV